MFEILKSYDVLGVEPGASLKAIKKAYRDKVKQWHPDRHQNNPAKKAEAEEKLKEINLAFEQIQEYHEKLSKLPPIKMTPPAPKPPPASPQPKPRPPPPPKPEATSSSSSGEDSAKNPQDSKPKQSETPKSAEAPRQTPRPSRRPWVIYATAAAVVLIGIAVGLIFVNRPGNIEEHEEEPRRVYLADLKSPSESKPATAPAPAPQPAGGAQGQIALLQSLAKSAGSPSPGRISVPETRLASRQNGEAFRFSPNEEMRPHALKELLKDKLTNDVSVSAPVSYGETPEDHYQRGLRYASRTVPNYEEAAKWYTLAAEAGHPAAQKSLGYLYASGKGVPENYAEAQKWFRRASAQGNAEASLAGTLASLVKTNVSSPAPEPDPPQPAHALTPRDYYERGLRYANGDGVAQDYTEAAKWYRLAADAGNTAAQRNLGYLYGSGKGVPLDYAEAQKWFRKASSQGDAGADLAGLVTSMAKTNHNPATTNTAPLEKISGNSK